MRYRNVTKHTHTQTHTRTHARTHTHTHMLSTCTEKRCVNSSFKERSEPWQELCNYCWGTEHNYQGAQTWFLYNSHFALTFLWITVSQQLANKNKFPIMTICHASWSKCLYTMYDCRPVQFLHRIQAAIDCSIHRKEYYTLCNSVRLYSSYINM
jgi:hypothetical protein